MFRPRRLYGGCNLFCDAGIVRPTLRHLHVGEEPACDLDAFRSPPGVFTLQSIEDAAYDDWIA